MNANGARERAAARGDLAEEMLGRATHMAVLVHGEGGPRDIHQALARLDDAAKDAMIVVLAGLVDLEQPVSDALGWLDFDETGAEIAPPLKECAALRTLAEGVEDEGDEPGMDPNFVDQVAVQAYADGRDVVVTKRERLEAVRLAVSRGLQYPDIDAMHGLTASSTATFISRSRLTFREWGIPFPEVEQPDAVVALTRQQVVEIRKRAEAGATDVEIAMSFGVARQTITNVVSGETYKQFGGPIRPKRGNVPSAASRVLWAHTSAVAPVFAEDLAVPA